MANRVVDAAALGEAALMQQTAHVRRDDKVRSRRRQMRDPSMTDRAGYPGEGHGKHAPEAATLFLLFGFEQLQPVDGREQLRNGADRRRAAVVTTGMEYDPRVQPPVPGALPQSVDDEIGELPRAAAQGEDVFAVRLAFEGHRPLVEDGRGAGPGRHDDRLVALEHPGDMPQDAAAGVPVSGGIARLAAAGLPFRESDLAAETFQHLDGRPCDVVEERIA